MRIHVRRASAFFRSPLSSVFMHAQGTRWLLERINPAGASPFVLVTMMESAFLYNVFGATTAQRDLQLADDTEAMLKAPTAIRHWAASHLRTVSKFIPSDELILMPEPEAEPEAEK